MSYTEFFGSPVEQGRLGDISILMVPSGPVPSGVAANFNRMQGIRPARNAGTAIQADPLIWNLTPFKVRGFFSGVLVTGGADNADRLLLIHLQTGSTLVIVKVPDSEDEYQISQPFLADWNTTGDGFRLSRVNQETILEGLRRDAARPAPGQGSKAPWLRWVATMMLYSVRNQVEYPNTMKLDGTDYRLIQASLIDQLMKPELDFFAASGPVTHIVTGTVDATPRVLPLVPGPGTGVWAVKRPITRRMDILTRDEQLLVRSDILNIEFQKVLHHYEVAKHSRLESLIQMYEEHTRTTHANRSVGPTDAELGPLYRAVIDQAHKRILSRMKALDSLIGHPVAWSPSSTTSSTNRNLNGILKDDNSFIIEENLGNYLYRVVHRGEECVVDATILTDMLPSLRPMQDLIRPKLGMVLKLGQEEHIVISLLKHHVLLLKGTTQAPSIWALPRTALRHGWFRALHEEASRGGAQFHWYTERNELTLSYKTLTWTIQSMQGIRAQARGLSHSGKVPTRGFLATYLCGGSQLRTLKEARETLRWLAFSRRIVSAGEGYRYGWPDHTVQTLESIVNNNQTLAPCGLYPLGTVSRLTSAQRYIGFEMTKTKDYWWLYSQARPEQYRFSSSAQTIITNNKPESVDCHISRWMLVGEGGRSEFELSNAVPSSRLFEWADQLKVSAPVNALQQYLNDQIALLKTA